MSILHFRMGGGSLVALWFRECEAILSNRFGTSSRAEPSVRLVVRPEDDGVTITLHGPDGGKISVEHCAWADYQREALDRMLGSTGSHVQAADRLVVLSVPQAVTGALAVPNQARTRADTILRDHLAHKMPVRLDELFLGHDIRASGAGKLELRYLAVPQARLDRWLAQVLMQPSEIAFLQAEGIGGAPLVTVPYLGVRTAQSKWPWRAAKSLAVVTLLAAIIGFGALAWRQNAALQEIEEQITPLTRQARLPTDQLKGIFGIADDIARFVELRSATGIVEIWEELAGLVPDSAYLTELEINGGEVLLAGFAASTPDVIRQLEESRHLHGASLTGPVVFDQAQGKERFTLRTMIRKKRFSSEEDK
jgi:general secretion pathway protein L